MNELTVWAVQISYSDDCTYGFTETESLFLNETDALAEALNIIESRNYVASQVSVEVVKVAVK